ncbi:MAG TPA: excinuclease ABC subunit A, partial [Pirellulaceae bacterium]|nr:excinuclease ABC subunit A [Pirellulaceae bacterium]
MASRNIELRGVSVHNLKHIDLDIPQHRLVVICGVSGSGKTSLALDTLYAEGQRRYIESFSLYTRQFLERLDKPQADRIDGLPASIAVTRDDVSRSSRATIGTATETIDYLRLLYAKIGRLFCPSCSRPVERSSPQSAAEQLVAQTAGTRLMVAFAAAAQADEARDVLVGRLKEAGFIRVVANGRTVNLADSIEAVGSNSDELLVIVDRLVIGQQAEKRLRDSLETAFRQGDGRAAAFVESSGAEVSPTVLIDDRPWQRLDFSARLECVHCHRLFADPEPRRFSFNSPLGACPTCEGFGSVTELDLNLVVPDPSKSIRAGAIAPWNT